MLTFTLLSRLICALTKRVPRSARFACVLAAACTLPGALCACGHNAIQYSDGIGISAGVDPEHFTASFSLRYGKILSVAARDCFELEMTGDAAGAGESASASAQTSSGLRIRIGRQVNGAARDLIESGATADQIHALLDQPSDKAFSP